MSRTANTGVSKENESFIKQGWYPSPITGGAVDLAGPVSVAKRAVVSYDVPATDRLLASITSSPSPALPTTLTVTAETSTSAAERLHGLGAPRIAVLNFASARHPGGGYLTGATAQEEDICRSSALYSTLLEAPDFYSSHARSDGLYSHRLVYSPNVPMYRASTGSLLPAPYPVDFITAAAPNVGALERNHPQHLPLVLPILRDRAARLLAACAHHGARTLVLGAWGCGVFRNSPAEVARVFHDLLRPGATFHGRFESVVFAIYDTSRGQAVMRAFEDEFAPKKGVAGVAARVAASITGRASSSAGSGVAQSTPPSGPSLPAKDVKSDGGGKGKLDGGGKSTDGQSRITSFFQAKPRDT